MNSDSSPIHISGGRLTFLIGCFRSGTSLLHRLVNRHPEVALMWECDALKFLPATVRPDWPQRLNLWNGAIDRHDINTENLLGYGSREEAAISLYTQYAKARDARIIGEKSPYYADIIRKLARRFPLARFVILTRDPAEVADSVRRAGEHNRFFRKPWMPLRVTKDAGRVRRDLDWLRKHGYSVHHLRFDTLIRDPETACQKIWRFLGLDPDPRKPATADVDSVPEGNHHFHVLHSEVDISRARVVSDRRASAYSTLWAGRFLTDLPGSVPPPGPLKLLQDEAAFQSCRIYDQLARSAFRRVPLPIVERHRHSSGHSVGKRKPPSSEPRGA